jgi:hypothetical protein
MYQPKHKHIEEERINFLIILRKTLDKDWAGKLKNDDVVELACFEL